MSPTGMLATVYEFYPKGQWQNLLVTERLWKLTNSFQPTDTGLQILSSDSKSCWIVKNSLFDYVELNDVLYWTIPVIIFFLFPLFSVAVSRSKDVPLFGPPVPKGVTFPKSCVFRDFLLAKVINGENAAHKSEKFYAMATRTRQEYLKDLAENFGSTATMDSALKFSFITLGAKKKERVIPRRDAHLHSIGAIMWSVVAWDFSQSVNDQCLLGISNEFIVLIEEESKNAVFNCSCRDVIGWTSTIKSIKLFYGRGECIMFSAQDGFREDIRQIVKRIEVST